MTSEIWKDGGCVALGAVAGAVLRHQIHSQMTSKAPGAKIWSTAAINIAGSLFLGWITSQTSTLSPRRRLLLGTGFCGAFTTFSTFSVETIALIEAGETAKAVAYVVSSNSLSIAAAFMGYRFGLPKVRSSNIKP